MSEKKAETTNETPIVIEPPTNATMAWVEAYDIRRREGGTTVALRGHFPSTNCRLVIHQSGVRRHFTYRILQQCSGIGGDALVPFAAEIGIGGVGGGATFLDQGGELQVLASNVNLKGGDGPFPTASDIDSPFPQGKADESSSKAAVANLLTVTGVLTDEGVECPAMREDNTDKLYTLVPRDVVDGFHIGERVTVSGTISEVSFCMQGTTIAVQSIRRA